MKPLNGPWWIRARPNSAIQSSLLNPSLPLSIFPSDELLNASCIKRPLITDSSNLIIIQDDNTTLFSLSAIVNPCRQLLESGVDGRSGPRTTTTGRGFFFSFFSDQMDAFFIQAFPFYTPTVLGSAASSPLHVCDLWIDLVQKRICFIISLSLPLP